MSVTLDFIRNEIENQSYEISLHADGLTVSQSEFVSLPCKIIEHYQYEPNIF